MDIIVVQSSLDDRLILRVSDDLLTQGSKSVRDDIHDGVHPESSRSGDTDGEVSIGRHEK